MGIVTRENESEGHLQYEIDCFIGEAIDLLALVVKFNQHCAGVEIEESSEYELKHACETMTSLFEAQFPGFDVDAVSLPPQIKSAMSSIDMTAQTILKDFDLLGPAADAYRSLVAKFGKAELLTETSRTYARLKRSGDMVTRCIVSLEEHHGDDGRVESHSFKLSCPFLPEGVPVFAEVIRFSDIDDRDVIQLKRAVHTLLGWQLENIPSDVSHQPPVGDRTITKSLSEAEQRIVDVIAAAGRRMTTTKVISSLQSLYGPTSEGVTKSNLAVLVRHGHLTNRSDVEPRGYGLPEWS